MKQNKDIKQGKAARYQMISNNLAKYKVQGNKAVKYTVS